MAGGACSARLPELLRPRWFVVGSRVVPGIPLYHRTIVPEAPLEETDAGLVPAGNGWFVLNAEEARWIDRPGRGKSLPFTGWTQFEAETYFPQLGINLVVLEPGEAMAMYHWETEQEDFLVLSGEPLLVVEGQERRLRPWDFVHCPPGTNHAIVGAGDGPCVVLAIGSREHQARGPWGAYTVDDVALRHGAAVEAETQDAAVAYARFPKGKPTRYRAGWLATMRPGRNSRAS